MGTIICTTLTFPIQVILQFVIPVLQTIATTICSWVTTTLTTLQTIVNKICGYMPWPLNKLCKFVSTVITIIQTITNWVCNTVIQTIIQWITMLVSIIYYITQVICVILNFILGIPGLILCRLNLTAQKRIRVCVKVVTDAFGNSQVTNAGIQSNIDLIREAYRQCNIEVEITGVERIVNPAILTSTFCGAGSLFTTWYAWFTQHSCLCCGKITVFFVDQIQNASGCSIWGANFCWVDAGANSDPSVAAHEIGHLLNLKHSNDPNNIMYKKKSPTSRKFTASQCCIMRASPYASY